MFRQIHGWLGLLIALQAVVWSLSGLIMTLLPAEEVSGEIYLSASEPQTLSAEKWNNRASLLDAIMLEYGEVQSLTIKSLPGTVVAEIVLRDSGHVIIDLETGKPLKLERKQIELLARQALAGDPELLFLEIIDSGNREYDGPLPAWKAIAGNAARSHLYLSPETGEVLAHRTKMWRWHRYSYDLHTFNFSRAASINNPVLSLMALLMLAVAVTGIVLLIIVLARRFGGSPN